MANAPTADQVLAGTDLAGHRALVTGAAGGIGYETARSLLKAGAETVVTARTQQAADNLGRRLSREIPNAVVTGIGMDLGSIGDVLRAADRLICDGAPLDVLIANAGVMGVPEGRTADGFETHIGVNHFGHFALITALEQLLTARAGARVVILSSVGHRHGDVDLLSLATGTTPYRRFRQYSASKTANVLCAVAIDRRWASRGVHAFAVHPGAVPATGLSRHLDDKTLSAMRAGGSAAAMSEYTPEQGAATSVWAATNPELAERGGSYLENCAVAAVTGPEATTGVRDYAVAPDAADELWERSTDLLARREK
ncbi:SDR family NAD(P)-dependent oxidoreductase [Nocardia sp. NPDC005366]|uniref:SDR family NAD(P)-dependent oxidoreductase n=1 Tax=Nocardia sp. NPDC005366 TaxID=3156878 RepID=UPI0033B9B62C